MRGKAVCGRGCGHSGRITPACAGKSWTLRSKLIQFKDHPRVCGEKFSPRPERRSLQGSPPRVRGKVRYGHGVHAGFRITPACAGKRGIPPFVLGVGEDHPRVCGEKKGACHALPGVQGSPPRVRGKGFAPFPLKILIRITPACAGKSGFRVIDQPQY